MRESGIILALFSLWNGLFYRILYICGCMLNGLDKPLHVVNRKDFAFFKNVLNETRVSNESKSLLTKTDIMNI